MPSGLSCLLLLSSSRTGDKDWSPIWGKKIFLCWNFQNLLSSYRAKDISDFQEGIKPVGVSPICLQRGRNITCLNTSSSDSLVPGTFPGSHCDLSPRTTLESITVVCKGGRREKTGCQTATTLKIKLPLLYS